MPFGEQLSRPPAASGAVATKKIRCCLSQAVTSGVIWSYNLPTDAFLHRPRHEPRPLEASKGLAGFIGVHQFACDSQPCWAFAIGCEVDSQRVAVLSERCSTRTHSSIA